MDSSAITAYPRHHSFHDHRSVRPLMSVPTGAPTYKPIVPINSQNRFYQYSSDPTLLDGRSSRTSDIDDASGGRRSAQDQYPQSEEDENDIKQARKEKKKKLKRLRSFVHVFFGGLHKKHSFQVSSGVADVHHGNNPKDIIATTRYRQRNERDGMSSSFKSSNESANTTSNNNTSAGKALLSRLPRSPDIPGLCGLQNHGNTCFMNAVLQCLSNTDQLAEYFVTDQYKNDINRQKSKARIFGTCGEVTEQFALLLKCLWNGQYDPRVTAQFKDVVGRHSEQYQGTSQHDAQEFFLWLLDNVHEDLNQAGRKKYRPIKDGVGRPDEEVAAETLLSHMKSNNSFIQNLFQGQFRSAIICPSCNTRSCTFDPYVCVSLPLPQQECRPVYVTVVYRSSGRKNKVYGVNMNVDGTIRDLRNNLAELCGVNRHHLVITDLTPSGFNRTFYDDQHISVISGGDIIFGFECPPYRGNNPEAFTQNNPSGSKELMLIMVINKFGQTQYGKRFGPPLILRIWRDLTHSQFQSVVLKAMSSYLREGVKLTDVCRTGVLFRCRVMDGLPGRCILPTEVEHPFYSPSVDKASHVSMLYGGPAHIKIVAEWEPETKASVFGVVPEEFPEPDESAAKLRELYQQPLQATLDDALRMYTREEILNREDSWYCVHCKHQQKDTTKKITLWTLPDVLVVHLKRFRQVGYSRTKLNTLVQFPITGLDMTAYLAPRNRPSSATLERRRSAAKIKSAKTLPSKSVHFEDETVVEKSKKGVNRSASSTSASSKFHFPWKKSKKEKTPPPSATHSSRTKSPEVSYSNCDSPCSVRSAPSTIGHSTHSPPPQEFNRQSSMHSLDQSRLDNVYDLYAICNHHGSMSRGHYTAYCRNPADGNWYTFDDTSIQSIPADQLVTAGAYMLFYVRQSLIAQSPLSSSESSTSSSSSNHWIYHIPQFRLDLGSLGSSSDDAQGPNINDTKSMRPRLGSANSAVSAPPLAGIRGVSPHSSAHDNDSDVFSPPNRQHAIDTQSAVSLPTSSYPLHAHQHTNPPPSAHHQHYPSSPNYRPFPNPPNYQMAVNQALASPNHNRITTSGRQASLRLGRKQHSHSTSADGTETQETPLRRSGSLHAPRRHAVKRTMTNGAPQYFDFPPNPYFASNKGVVMPSRSIPNMSEMESAANRASGEYAHLLPQQGSVVPSRSIPNMSGEMTPGPPRAARTFSDDPALHFMTPQLHQRNFGRAAGAGFSMSQNMGNMGGAESCV